MTDAQGRDDERISEIRARLEAATPGPWEALTRAPDWGATEIGAQLDTPDARVIADTELWGRQPTEQNVQDAAFIAHAREDVPFLLARLGALEAERDAARAWSARWKAVSKRLWAGIHKSLDQSERLAARMLKAEAERDRDKATISELMRLHYERAPIENDLAARLAAALAALREIEGVSRWQSRYLEWKRSAQKVGLCPSSDLAVNEIKHLARQALAALAGSSEPATTEGEG